MLKTNEVQQIASLFHLDKQVEIAPPTLITPGKGTKDPNPGNAMAKRQPVY